MADFYGTAIGFTAYHVERGNTVPADIDTDAEIEAGLLKASEWLDAAYRSSFDGYKDGGRDQIREWPRTGHTDYYGYSIATGLTPREIENATYEAALREFTTTGSLSTDWTPSKYQSVSVDGAVSAKFTQFNSASETQTQFQMVAEIMAALIPSSANLSSNSGDVVRV